MFIGHFGLGLATKKISPAISLGTLFLAAQFLDLLWPTFLLLGWEQVVIDPGNTRMTPLDFVHYPLTHSLTMACVWGLVVGGIYYLLRRSSFQGIVVGLCVVSHWILDAVVHRPDLPLYPGGTSRAGLGLWNNVPIEIVIEGLIFFGGLYMYLKSTQPKDRVGTYGFWSMIGLLVLIHIANLLGPPPPSVPAIAWAGQLQWLFVLWAFWVDKHRVAARASSDII